MFIIYESIVKYFSYSGAKPLAPWFIAEKSGEILYVHCNCMAGLGESCSHVGALLFYVEAAVRIRESKTVTGEKALSQEKKWYCPDCRKLLKFQRKRKR